MKLLSRVQLSNPKGRVGLGRFDNCARDNNFIKINMYLSMIIFSIWRGFMHFIASL